MSESIERKNRIRGSKEWCEILAHRIVQYHLDNKVPWDKLREYVADGGGEEITPNDSWRIVWGDLKYAHDFPRDAADLARKLGVPTDDIRLLFDKSRETAIKKDYE